MLCCLVCKWCKVVIDKTCRIVVSSNVYYKSWLAARKSKKRVPDQLLGCGIGDLWRFWMVWNWSWMIRGITWNHANMESFMSYSANQELFFDVSYSKPALADKMSSEFFKDFCRKKQMITDFLKNSDSEFWSEMQLTSPNFLIKYLIHFHIRIVFSLLRKKIRINLFCCYQSHIY